MSFKNATEKKSFEPIPPGYYDAVCYSIIDIGTQETEYQDVKDEKNQVVIIWEIPAYRIKKDKDGNNINKPYVISNFYNMSMHPKAKLRKDIEKLLGRKLSIEELKDSFDLPMLIGKNCKLVLRHDEKPDGSIKVKIDSVLPMQHQGTVIEIENNAVIFDIDSIKDKNFAGIDSKNIPEWICKFIYKSKEWIEMETGRHTQQQSNSSVKPFIDDPNTGQYDDEQAPIGDPPPSQNDIDEEVPF